MEVYVYTIENEAPEFVGEREEEWSLFDVWS